MIHVFVWCVLSCSVKPIYCELTKEILHCLEHFNFSRRIEMTWPLCLEFDHHPSFCGKSIYASLFTKSHLYSIVTYTATWWQNAHEKIRHLHCHPGNVFVGFFSTFMEFLNVYKNHLFHNLGWPYSSFSPHSIWAFTVILCWLAGTLNFILSLFIHIQCSILNKHLQLGQ